MQDPAEMPLDTAIVYAPRKGELAILCFAKSFTQADLVACGVPVGGAVANAAMFE